MQTILRRVPIREYRKNSKNWDTLNYYRDCPTNGIVGYYSAILRSKDADRITNRVDTDQTAPSSLIWVCTVCSDLSVPIFQIITLTVLKIVIWGGTSSVFMVGIFLQRRASGTVKRNL